MQPGDASEVYTKDEKSINKEKVAGVAKQYCEKLGAYRMPFAVTAMQLMNVVTGANSLDKDSTLGSDNSSTGSSGSLGIIFIIIYCRFLLFILFAVSTAECWSLR